MLTLGLAPFFPLRGLVLAVLPERARVLIGEGLVKRLTGLLVLRVRVRGEPPLLMPLLLLLLVVLP